MGARTDGSAPAPPADSVRSRGRHEDRARRPSKRRGRAPSVLLPTPWGRRWRPSRPRAHEVESRQHRPALVREVQPPELTPRPEMRDGDGVLVAESQGARAGLPRCGPWTPRRARSVHHPASGSSAVQHGQVGAEATKIAEADGARHPPCARPARAPAAPPCPSGDGCQGRGCRTSDQRPLRCRNSRLDASKRSSSWPSWRRRGPPAHGEVLLHEGGHAESCSCTASKRSWMRRPK